MNQIKKKNIILCADGTGNKGGYTPDSNVYKIYNAIDLHNESKDGGIKQITFYDNGVGTETNKYLRALGGAIGIGFNRNVKDLYEFLARNYREGDDIYLFGFSRGAATIRAFNGFMYKSGLVNGWKLGNKELKKKVDIAMRYYSRPNKKNKAALASITHNHLPKIKFIGAWDTVSALGFPEGTDKVGLGLRIIHHVLRGIGWFTNLIIPHNFYDFELTTNVIEACHAISIDDERRVFKPMVWKEKIEAAVNTKVNQVWFAGMHSNVGGGYERAGLANVAFSWMLENIEKTDLILKEGVREEAKANSNVNGRMYDSRLGFAAYYSFHPRNIKKLCEDAGTPIQIHKTVMERLTLRSANYAPKLLPKEFTEVHMVDGEVVSNPSPVVHNKHWNKFNKRIRHFIIVRKWLYGILLELTISVIVIACYVRIKEFYIYSACETLVPIPDYKEGVEGFRGFVSRTLDAVLPDFLDGLIQKAFIQHPLYGFIGGIIVASYIFLRWFVRKRTTVLAERLRKLYLISPKGHPMFLTSKEAGED